MDLHVVFDSSQLALRDTVRDYLATKCTPADVRAGWNTPTARSADRWRELAALGVVGLTVPREFGGQGLDETSLVLLLEEAGRAALPEPLGPVAVATALLADAGSDAERMQWLPQIAAGDAIVVASVPGRPWIDDAHIADLLLIAEGTEVHAVAPDRRIVTLQPSLDPGRRQYAVNANLNARSCMAVWARDALAAAADRAALAEAAFLLGTAAKLVEIAGRCAPGAGGVRVAEAAVAEAVAAVAAARPVVYGAAWSVARNAQGRTAHVDEAHALAARAATRSALTASQATSGAGDDHDVDVWLQRGLLAQGS